VTDTRHLHLQSFVVDGIYHAVVADANAPFAVSALQLLAARWARIEARFSKRGTMRAINWPDSFLSSFAALEVNATS
jgi:hypothetical protein